MYTGSEKDEALRLLAGLENGGMPSTDASFIAEKLDPVLIYFLVRYFRECYPASDPVAATVLERVVKMTSANADIVRKSREGEQDPVTGWFNSEFSIRDYRGRGRELIELIADKLDS